ncbi:unnamed protein product [Orchesella dallaii]|uniref:HTH OST-type domain-containing protein n=1 Tax=Orchesella dallaii TaxID=48710 RepID=A0ABP1S7Q9_9HEXA
MAPVSSWQWNPNPKQKELFEEWKKFCISLLITSREGFHVRSIPKMLEEQTGEPMPIRQMGFPSINHFLYTMAEHIEIRSLMGQHYVFVRDHSIPQELQHVRDMVLGQQKDKSCKSRTGKIRRPSKKQSCYVPIHEFLAESANAYSAYQQQQQRNPLPSRPVLVPMARYTNRNFGTSNRGINRSSSYQNNASSSRPFTTPKYPASKPSNYAVSTPSFTNWSDVPKTSNTPKPPLRNIQPEYTAPARPRYIEGLLDDDDTDDSDLEGFEIVSSIPSFKNQNKAASTMPPVSTIPAANSAVTSGLSSTTTTARPVQPSMPVTTKSSELWKITPEVASTSLTNQSNANAPSNFSYTTPTEIQQPRTVSSSGMVNNISNLHPRAIIGLRQTPSVVREQDEMVQSVINRITSANASHYASLQRESPKKLVSNPDPPKLKQLVEPSVETFTAPNPSFPVENKPASAAAKPVIDLHPNVGLQQTQSNGNLESKTRISAVIDLHPNIGYMLDRRNDLIPGSSAIRISFHLPNIKFPSFLKGGTKECNSLKAFLQLTKQSLDSLHPLTG